MIRLHCEVPGEVFYIHRSFPVRQISRLSFETTYKIIGAIRLTAKAKTHGALTACLRRAGLWSGVSVCTRAACSLCVFLKSVMSGGDGVHFKQAKRLSLKWERRIWIYGWFSPFKHNFIVQYQDEDL